jgi:hypothetical protein
VLHLGGVGEYMSQIRDGLSIQGIWGSLKTPVFNRGMTYQTKEKGLIKVSIQFVGGVTLIEQHTDK